MSATVVIPTTLTSPGLARTLDSVIASASLLGPDSEVLLVVNGTASRACLPRVDSPLLRVIELERASAPAARNAGIDAAHHDTVIFTDDDCLVSESWCTDLHRALRGEGRPAVAAPVRIAVNGPVTAFLNHQRFFDAPALDASDVRYLVTANCGYRRDLAPPDHRFDPVNFNNAAEDADFGYRLRDAGIPLHWLTSSTPIQHALTESITEITERFLRYGRANARLYLRRGRWRESVPCALDWYQSIVRAEYLEYRRFWEFPQPQVRNAFTLYDLLVTACFLCGYLEELGAHLNHRLITVESDYLTDRWRAMADRITERPASSEAPDWTDLPVDFHRLRRPARTGDVPIRDVARELQRHAVPVRSVPRHVDDELRAWTDEFDAETTRVNQRLYRVWDDLDTGDGEMSIEALESAARSVGASFSDGCHDIEKMMYDRNELPRRTMP